MRRCLLLCIGLIGLHAGSASALVLYRISGLSDIALPAWSIGDPAVQASIDVCAYTSLLGNYAITASSAGGFLLSSGANTIPYSLKWEDSGAGNLGSNGGNALTSGVALTGRANANASILSNDCSTGTPAGANARLTLTITQAAMNAAPAGTYSGTLTLTISAL